MRRTGRKPAVICFVSGTMSEIIVVAGTQVFMYICLPYAELKEWPKPSFAAGVPSPSSRDRLHFGRARSFVSKLKLQHPTISRATICLRTMDDERYGAEKHAVLPRLQERLVRSTGRPATSLPGLGGRNGAPSGIGSSCPALSTPLFQWASGLSRGQLTCICRHQL